MRHKLTERKRQTQAPIKTMHVAKRTARSKWQSSHKAQAFADIDVRNLRKHMRYKVWQQAGGVSERTILKCSGPSM